MPKYQIQFGLGGGFGGPGEWEDVTASTREEAEMEAYERACEEYESYVGLHGLREVQEIMDEDGLTESEALQAYDDERESWLDYGVREVPEG